jgi:putative transposase
MAQYKGLFLDGHSYFLTVVTHRRIPVLIENIDLLRESFRENRRYFSYKIDAIVVLPDHFHIIITPEKSTDYPYIIKSIKYNFSKRYNAEKYGYPEQLISRHRRGLKPIWQKRYYEHTIRDEKDYVRCLEYMRHNPVKHQCINSEKDWQYSSFR